MSAVTSERLVQPDKEARNTPMNIKFVGCAPKNFLAGRPAGLEIDAVVIHLIDGSQAGADATFLDNTLQNPRSAHYSVGKDGAVHQYVEERDTAFHCGRILNPTWAGLKKNAVGGHVNPNFYTIAIEHAGRPNDDWTDEMYAASGELLGGMCQKYPKLKTLTRSNLVMHREIRADKSCPGFKADLDRLIRAARGVAAPPTDEPDVVTTVKAVNLRSGRPSMTAPVIRTIPAGTLMHVVGSTEGDAVPDANNRVIRKWFQTLDGDFFWAGATDKP